MRVMRSLIMPLVLAALSVQTGLAKAQSTLPPLRPNGSSEACMNGFRPLRDEGERRGQLVRQASARHALPAEACKLIGEYASAEVKMIEYVEANATTCEIAPQLLNQLKAGYETTDRLLQRICAASRGQKQWPDGPPQINDFADPAFQHQ